VLVLVSDDAPWIQSFDDDQNPEPGRFAVRRHSDRV